MIIRQNVVLLGASNLVLGWRAAVQSLRETIAEPIDLRVAMGMGRSYLTSSSFLFRRLPAIGQCGLWEDLPQDPELAPFVLITDLGNDIVYLFEPEQIAEAVRQCLIRIREWSPNAKIILTGLPLASLESVGRMRFLLARTILFPGCRLPLPTVLGRAQSLDMMVRQLANEFGVPIVQPNRSWYGLDPIHVVAKYRMAAFRKYFEHFGSQANGTTNPGRSYDSLRICLPNPAQSLRFGGKKSIDQPTFRSPDFSVAAW